MRLLPRQVPSPIAYVLSKIPSYPGSFVFASGLNFFVINLFSNDVKILLEGKRLRICIRDARLSFDFLVSNGHFLASKNKLLPDLCITASAYDFSLLARKQVDPDTLFFNRRLSMEGDTELGILVKNSLDAIETSVLDLRFLKPSIIFGQLKKIVERI